MANKTTDKIKRMNKPVTILRQLLEGWPIEITEKSKDIIPGEYLFDDKKRLCLKGTKIRLGKDAKEESDEHVWYPINFGDFTLTQFIEWCEMIHEQDFIANCGRITLTKINQKKRGN